MNILRLLLLIQAFLAIFVAGGLFFRESKISSRSIAVFILFLGVEILEFLYSTSAAVKLYPELYGLYFFPVGFIYGPVFFLHIVSVVKAEKVRTRYAIHFLPFVIVTLSLVDIFQLPGTERIAYLSESFMARVMPYNYARAAHILGYGLGSVIFLLRHQPRLKAEERGYAVAICTIYFLSAIAISWLTEFADGWRQFIYYYLIINTLVYLIAYLMVYKPDWLKGLGKKYLRSNLSRLEMERISQKIHQQVGAAKLFLDRELSLKKVADLIGERPHRVSQTFSEVMGRNFNDFINSHRVEYAKKMLLDPAFDHYKIEAIALDSGFNNKVTFYKVFLKATELTPTAFRNTRI